MNQRSYQYLPGPANSANCYVRLNKPQRRHGLTFTEVVVAATLVVSMIGFVAPLTVRIGRVWQSTRQYRLAFNELANQMELLTSLSVSSCEAALSNLKPSENAARSLPEARLDGQLVRDQDGTRLILSIDWERGSKSVPVSLVGWLDTNSIEPITPLAREREAPAELLPCRLGRSLGLPLEPFHDSIVALANGFQSAACPADPFETNGEQP